jgi:hypothetical protein
MQRFKKRVRLLAEQQNSSVEYGHNDSLLVHANSGSATFTPKSYELMTCSIDLGNGPRTFPLPKEYVFDIVDRLGTSHLASTLLDYPKPPILTLQDYINDEHGLPFLKALQQELEDNPALVHKELGGNRILAEYFRGVLVLRDDLVMAATNVAEFSASSPALGKAT